MSGYDDAALERRVAEPRKATETGRSPFVRDRARVLHSAAFRRLAGKTQVVGAGVEDFPRTRLTHSLECAQIGRELAGALGADPDLVDAACLAHDLGHPPFGHNGETALDQAAAGCGGFEGNAQSLRVLTRLEAKAVDGDGRSAGLNLTRAVLDGATKYPWLRTAAPASAKYGAYADDAAGFAWVRAGAGERLRCFEAQLMDWADDVAYSVHDFEDGVQAGLIHPERLADPMVGDAVADLAARVYSPEPAHALRDVYDALVAQPWWIRSFDHSLGDHVALKRMTSELTGRFCASAVAATRRAHGTGRLLRYAADLVVPDVTRAECAVLKAVAHRFVMLRTGAEELQAAERWLMTQLVAAIADGAPGTLAPELRPMYADASGPGGRLRVVVDQVASLTDISARRWHARLVP